MYEPNDDCDHIRFLIDCYATCSDDELTKDAQDFKHFLIGKIEDLVKDIEEYNARPRAPAVGKADIYFDEGAI